MVPEMKETVAGIVRGTVGHHDAGLGIRLTFDRALGIVKVRDSPQPRSVQPVNS
jgi:hypothetical protein